MRHRALRFSVDGPFEGRSCAVFVYARFAWCAPGHSGETACRIVWRHRTEEETAPMRAYIETIAMILGLLGAYFALLPLTI
jgi:hypothetical protein